MFRPNGSCGFVLKPLRMRQCPLFTPMIVVGRAMHLALTVISAVGLPRAAVREVPHHAHVS
jgi:hypothetical protein